MLFHHFSRKENITRGLGTERKTERTTTSERYPFRLCMKILALERTITVGTQPEKDAKTNLVNFMARLSLDRNGMLWTERGTERERPEREGQDGTGRKKERQGSDGRILHAKPASYQLHNCW